MSSKLKYTVDGSFLLSAVTFRRHTVPSNTMQSSTPTRIKGAGDW